MNNTDNGLYNEENILSHGTIFKELFKPYKNYFYETRNLLSSLILGKHDLKLYLDIYPNDEKVKMMYNEYERKINAILNSSRKDDINV